MEECGRVHLTARAVGRRVTAFAKRKVGIVSHWYGYGVLSISTTGEHQNDVPRTCESIIGMVAAMQWHSADNVSDSSCAIH